jgi:hypothetical protein
MIHTFDTIIIKMEDIIMVFIKFGSEVNMLDLIDNGTVCMNSLQNFRQIEDNYLRGDSYEGIFKLWNLPAGSFEIPTINYKGHYEHFHLAKRYKTTFGNLYSLYSVSSNWIEDPEEFQIDARVIEFGSHAVVIKDLPEFFRRMESKLKVTGHEFHHSFVEYYDKNAFNGEATVFQKPIEFAYQREFRFFLQREAITPISLSIGSMRDIAEIFPSEALLTLSLEKGQP